MSQVLSQLLVLSNIFYISPETNYALRNQREKLRGGGRCQRNAEAIQVHATDLSLDYPVRWFSEAFLGAATILRPSEKLPSTLSLQPASRQFSGLCWGAALMLTPAYTSVSHRLQRAKFPIHFHSPDTTDAVLLGRIQPQT